MKKLSIMLLFFAGACVPMDKDTGFDSGYDYGTSSDKPGCKTTTYCYEATWLTEDNCANGFDYLESGCPVLLQFDPKS